jgi:hypothetical protein
MAANCVPPTDLKNPTSRNSPTARSTKATPTSPQAQAMGAAGKEKVKRPPRARTTSAAQASATATATVPRRDGSKVLCPETSGMTAAPGVLPPAAQYT